jgi:hypothetical protein
MHLLHRRPSSFAVHTQQASAPLAKWIRAVDAYTTHRFSWFPSPLAPLLITVTRASASLINLGTFASTIR